MARDQDDELKQLIADLDHATNIYLQGINDREDSDSGRAGVCDAIEALGRHCDRIGVPVQALKPIMALARALLDLDQGTQAPLLRPVSTGKRSPYSTDHQHVRMTAAASMQLYMDAGFKRKEAAARVAGKLARFNTNFHKMHKAGSDGNPATTVEHWRDEMKNKSADDPLGKGYRKMIQNIKKEELPPRKAADRLLKGLRYFLNVKA